MLSAECWDQGSMQVAAILVYLVCSPVALGPAVKADSLLSVGWKKNSVSLMLLVSTFLESM